MHVQPVINAVQAALAGQGGLASGDPSVEAALSHLAEALGPALRVAALELAQQAASEVGAQLPDHTIDVVLADGDPALRVTESKTSTDRPASEEFDARITLRLPPSLKELIEDAAGDKGDSVNGWVVDALAARAAKGRNRGAKYTQSFDLWYREERFPIEGRGRIDVVVPAGSIQIGVGDNDEIAVSIEANDPDQFEVSCVGNTVSVIQPPKWLMRTRVMRVVARVPQGCDIEVRSASGNIELRGILGAVRARTASGDIDAERVGRLEVNTTSGDARVMSTDGDASFNTASGDVLVGRVDGRLTASLASGDVRADHASGNVDVGTASGDVTIARCDGDEIFVKTTSGDIRLGLPTGIRVEPEISTLSGRTTLPAPARTAASSPDRRVVRVRLRSVSGDIRIDRVG